MVDTRGEISLSELFSTVDNNGRSPLLLAREKFGQTQMHLAVSKGDVNWINNVVETRGETSVAELFNAMDKSGKSPLFLLSSKSPTSFKNILQEIDPTGVIAQDTRLLQYVARQGNIKLVSTLISLGCKVDSPSEDGSTAFTCALGTLNTG